MGIPDEPILRMSSIGGGQAYLKNIIKFLYEFS